jgi:hypothetical protein
LAIISMLFWHVLDPGTQLTRPTGWWTNKARPWNRSWRCRPRLGWPGRTPAVWSNRWPGRKTISNEMSNLLIAWWFSMANC